MKPKTDLPGNIVFRPYEDRDEEQIIELFKKVFRKTMGPSESHNHWEWEYKKNPTNILTLILGWDDKRLVGQYAALPNRIITNGKIRTGALSLDSMTDPDYSGRGVFTNAGKTLYSCLSKKKISFVYGFPNANVIYARTNKLDWKIISKQIPIYIRPLQITPIFKNVIKVELLGNILSILEQQCIKISEKWASEIRKNRNVIIVRRENAFGTWANDLWHKCKNQHKIWLIRDLEYLEWRYNARPESEYHIYTAWHKNEISGYMVSTEQSVGGHKVTFILDLLANKKVEGACDALLRKSISDARSNGSSMLCSILMPNSAYRIRFIKHLFIVVPRVLLPQKTFFGGRLICRDKDLKTSTFFDPNSWQITWGDTDLL